jgi:hypothetical protein
MKTGQFLFDGYLIENPSGGWAGVITPCFAACCLFDGYLMEAPF